MPAAEYIAPPALLQLQGKAPCCGGGYRLRQQSAAPAAFLILNLQRAVGVLLHGKHHLLRQRQILRCPPQQQDLLLSAVFLSHVAQLLGRKTLVPALLYGRTTAQHLLRRCQNIVLSLPTAHRTGDSLCCQHQQRPRGARRRTAASRHKGGNGRLPRTQRTAQQRNSLLHSVSLLPCPVQGLTTDRRTL